MRRASVRIACASTPGDRRRPARILRHAVARAGEVGFEPLEPHRVPSQKLPVMETFGAKRVGETEHERDVGVRPGRKPLRTQVRMDVAAKRGDVDERDAGVRGIADVVALDVSSRSAVADLGVLHRQPAERDQQIGVFDDRRPTRVDPEQPEQIAENVRQDDLARREAVRVALVGESADAVQKPAELTRSVMEPPGARPAIGAGEDRTVAVLADDPFQLTRDEPARLVPRDGDERLGAPPRAVRSGTAPEPPPAHHRLGDAARIVQGVQHAVRDGRGIEVLLESVQRRQPAVAHHRAVRAPVSRRQRQIVVRVVHSQSPQIPSHVCLISLSSSSACGVPAHRMRPLPST